MVDCLRDLTENLPDEILDLGLQETSIVKIKDPIG
jgi:hypothetical protein